MQNNNRNNKTMNDHDISNNKTAGVYDILKVKSLCVSHIVIITLALGFILSSCSTTTSSWDCPMQDGAGCRTIYEADHNVDSNCKGKKCKKAQKELSSKYIDKKAFINHIKETEKSEKGKNTQSYSETQYNTSTGLKSLRTKEKVSRVVFAPFIDSNGNRHEESVVYIVDEQPNWRR